MVKSKAEKKCKQHTQWRKLTSVKYKYQGVIQRDKSENSNMKFTKMYLIFAKILFKCFDNWQRLNARNCKFGMLLRLALYLPSKLSAAKKLNICINAIINIYIYIYIYIRYYIINKYKF